MRVPRLFLALLAALLPALALAATLNVSWTTATTYADGTPLGANLRGTLIEYGTCGTTAGSFGTPLGETFITGTGNTTQFTVGWGQFCVRGFTETVSGTRSASSNVASKTVAEPLPNPPAGLIAP